MRRLLVMTALLVGTTVSGAAYARSLLGHPAVRLFPKRGVLELGYTFSGAGGLDRTGGSEVSGHVALFSFGLPVARFDRAMVILRLDYGLHVARFRGGPTFFRGGDFDLHTLGVSASLIYALSKSWMLNAGVAPTLQSDFQGFSRDDLVPNARLLASWAWSQSGMLTFGVVLNKRFGGLRPYPVLGVILRPSGAWYELTAILPAFIRFGVRAWDRVRPFVDARLVGSSWHVTGAGPVPDFFTQLLEARIGAGARIGLAGGLYLEVEGGVTPFRRVDLRDATGTQVTTDVDPAPYVQVLLGWRPRRPARPQPAQRP